MYKSAVLLLALCAQLSLGSVPQVIIKNGFGRQVEFTATTRGRCICLKNSDVYSIEGRGATGLRFFASDNCIGNFVSPGQTGIWRNVEWVNSIYFGPPGGTLEPPTCPNLFPISQTAE